MTNWTDVLRKNITNSLTDIAKDDREKAFRQQYPQHLIEEMFDEMLDEEGEIHIGSLTYSKSWTLKQIDPTAYRTGVNELEDSLLEDFDDTDHYEEGVF